MGSEEDERNKTQAKDLILQRYLKVFLEGLLIHVIVE